MASPDDFVPPPVAGRDSFVVLFKGGRLPSWHLLSEAERTAAEQDHIDLMLSVAKQHGMRRLEGFRLMGQQHDWQRFWLIEFPTLDGAEAWIEAEIAPPYGLYGYYEYHLARPFAVDNLATWPTFPRSEGSGAAGPGVRSSGAANPRAQQSASGTADPHRRPALSADRSSVVVLLFGRGRPGYEGVSPETRGDEEHVRWMQGVARDHRMIRIEAFQVIARPSECSRVTRKLPERTM